MAKMRAMVVRKRGGPLEAEERDIPVPGPEEMRIRVLACGVCHSDVATVQGLFPNVKYPRVPGHEVIGVVDAIGEGVHGWSVGARAGVGWFGGSCGYCRRCRRDAAFACENVNAADRRDPRRRLCDPHDRACLRSRARAGRSRPRRIRAPALRRRHHLQRAAPHRRRPGRHRRGPWRRRPRPSRHSVCRAARLPHRRGQPRPRQGGAGEEASAQPTISTAPPKTRRRR